MGILVTISPQISPPYPQISHPPPPPPPNQFKSPHFIFVFLSPLVVTVPLSGPEKCAVDIHKSCEKKIFDQMVVNHFPWPKTTKWRECYNKALMRTSCTARILQNYATLQREFGENLRQQEYSSGLFGIFMNDNQLSLQL